jgi:predicted nucleic acid-binding protein
MRAGNLVYLDTSGVLAYLDADDACHSMAESAWSSVLDAKSKFLMTDWVRLECWSLVQRRLGIEAVADFHQVILKLCQMDTVAENRFELLSRQVLLSRRRNLSLVDLSSFDSMQRHGIKQAIAFDKHFTEHGFVTPDMAEWKSSHL